MIKLKKVIMEIKQESLPWNISNNTPDDVINLLHFLVYYLMLFKENPKNWICVNFDKNFWYIINKQYPKINIKFNIKDKKWIYSKDNSESYLIPYHVAKDWIIKDKTSRNSIREIMDSNSPPVVNIRSYSTNILSNDFINYMKLVENGVKKGFDSKKNVWYPHKSVEGGLPTIAYGHKIKNDHELKSFSNGIRDEDALKLLSYDLSIANKHVHEYITRMYKVNLILTPKQEQMLTDFAYNGVLEKFPKFVDAVLKNDVSKMRSEYKRFSGGKELTDRNRQFFNTFLK